LNILIFNARSGPGMNIIFFAFSEERVKNKHPKNPWPRPDIVNIMLLNKLYRRWFSSDNQMMSRQGGPVDPVKKDFWNYLLARAWCN
jgi:hypothetical protein